MAFFPSSSKPETRSLWPFFHHHFLWPSSAALLYFYGFWLLPGTHSDKSRIISLFCQLMSNLKSMCRLNSPLPWNNILLGIRMWIAFWGRGFSANHSLTTRPCLFLKSSYLLDQIRSWAFLESILGLVTSCYILHINILFLWYLLSTFSIMVILTL